LDFYLLWGNINKIENYFLEEALVSSHHSIPTFLPCNEKVTSCVVNSISNLFVFDQEEDFLVDNGTFWVTPMVTSGSHYPISFSPSQEME